MSRMNYNLLIGLLIILAVILVTSCLCSQNINPDEVAGKRLSTLQNTKKCEPSTAPTKEVMHFAKMIPDDITIEGYFCPDVSKLLADTDVIFSRLAQKQSREEMEKDFVDHIYWLTSVKREGPIKSFADFKKTDFAKGSIAKILVRLPATDLGNGEVKVNPLDLCREVYFFKNDARMMSIKKHVMNSLEQAKEDLKKSPDISESLKKVVLDANTVKAITYNGVEILSRSTEFFIFLDDTLIYSNLEKRVLLKQGKFLFKQIVDTLQGRKAPLASDEYFLSALDKLSWKEKVIYIVRPHKALKSKPEEGSILKKSNSEYLPELTVMGYYSDNNNFCGSLDCHYKNAGFIQNIGTNASALLRYIPEQDLRSFSAMEIDLRNCSGGFISFLASIVSDSFMQRKYKSFVELLKDPETNDVDDEFKKLFGGGGFYAVYKYRELFSDDPPEFLIGINADGSRMKSSVIEKLKRKYPDLSVVKEEVYSDYSVSIFLGKYFCVQHKDMFLISMHKNIIEKAINGLKGKESCVINNKQILSNINKEDAGVIAYLNGPKMRSDIVGDNASPQADFARALRDAFRNSTIVVSKENDVIRCSGLYKLDPISSYKKK